MSGQCGKPSVRRDVLGGVRAERRERVVALDASRRVAAGCAVRRRARRRRRARSARARSRCPGGRAARRAGSGRRLDLLERHAARARAGSEISPRLPEAITDDLGRRSSSGCASLESRCAASSPAPATSAIGASRAGRVAVSVAVELGQAGADVGARLRRRRRRRRGRSPSAAGRLDELLERVAVALAGTSRPATGRGRRARRARRAAARARRRRRSGRSPVDLAQHRERVGALDARSGGRPRRRRGTSCRRPAARRACRR